MKIKPYFLQKIKVKNYNVVCCNFCLKLKGLRIQLNMFFPLDIIWLHAKVWLYGFHFGNILSLSHI